MEINEKRTTRYYDYNLPQWFKKKTGVIIPLKQNLESQFDRIPSRLRKLGTQGLKSHLMSILHATGKGPLSD